MGQDGETEWVTDPSTYIAPASLTDLLVAEVAARL
jgi:hypothetical protein